MRQVRVRRRLRNHVAVDEAEAALLRIGVGDQLLLGDDGGQPFGAAQCHDDLAAHHGVRALAVGGEQRTAVLLLQLDAVFLHFLELRRRHQRSSLGAGDHDRGGQHHADGIVEHGDLALVFRLLEVEPRGRRQHGGVVDHGAAAPGDRHRPVDAVDEQVRILAEQWQHLGQVRHLAGVDRLDQAGFAQAGHIAHVGRDDVDRGIGGELGDDLVVVGEVGGRQLDARAVQESLGLQRLVIALPAQPIDLGLGKGAAR
jgi:hypothetical protein